MCVSIQFVFVLLRFRFIFTNGWIQLFTKYTFCCDDKWSFDKSLSSKRKTYFVEEKVYFSNGFYHIIVCVWGMPLTTNTHTQKKKHTHTQERTNRKTQMVRHFIIASPASHSNKSHPLKTSTDTTQGFINWLQETLHHLYQRVVLLFWELVVFPWDWLAWSAQDSKGLSGAVVDESYI